MNIIRTSKIFNFYKKINIRNFSTRLNETQQEYSEIARKFSENEIMPYAKKWDEEKIFPKETFKKLSDMGFGGLFIEEEYGGTNVSKLEASLIFEGLSTGCVSTTAYLSIHNMVGGIINKYGNEYQKENFLNKINNFDYYTSYCLTEPNSGSDAASLNTKAIKEKDYYNISGSKAFISGGGNSDLYLVFAKTENGISSFIIPKETEGLSFGKQEEKLGWNNQPTSSVNMENCKIPEKYLVGQEGKGFNIAMEALDSGRINIASCSLGGSKYCLENTVDYLHQRKQFGKPIIDNQYIQFKIAQLYTDFFTSQLLVRNAAIMIDENDTEKTKYSAIAKKQATNIGFNIADECLQLHGGYGYTKDYPIERYFRDLRVHKILEGTNEIMDIIIYKNIIKNR